VWRTITGFKKKDLRGVIGKAEKVPGREFGKCLGQPVEQENRFHEEALRFCNDKAEIERRGGIRFERVHETASVRMR